MKPNPNYDVRAAGGDQAKKHYFVEPANLSPDYFIPELLGGRAFYSKAEVMLDGVRLDAPNMDEQGLLPQNRKEIVSGKNFYFFLLFRMAVSTTQPNALFGQTSKRKVRY